MSEYAIIHTIGYEYDEGNDDVMGDAIQLINRYTVQVIP
jgi:hypothetical protein